MESITIIILISYCIALYIVPFFMKEIKIHEEHVFEVTIIVYLLLMFSCGVSVGFFQTENAFYVCFVGRLIPVVVLSIYSIAQVDYGVEFMKHFRTLYCGVLSSFMCGYGGMVGFNLRQRL